MGIGALAACQREHLPGFTKLMPGEARLCSRRASGPFGVECCYPGLVGCV
jgi:hypothetical protein